MIGKMSAKVLGLTAACQIKLDDSMYVDGVSK